MQLTNVCRDVVEDWERGRVYVPAELLDPATVAWSQEHESARIRQPLPETARGPFAHAARELLARAERYYASADLGIAYLEPRSALAVRTARLVYAEIGRRIEARGCDVLAGRAVVPSSRKLRLAGRALRRFAAERRSWTATPLVAPSAVLRCGEAVRLA
jgi:phytoene synthase